MNLNRGSEKVEIVDWKPDKKLKYLELDVNKKKV